VPLVTDDELLIVGVRDCAVHKNTSNTSSFLSPLSSSVQVCVCVCVCVHVASLRDCGSLFRRSKP